MEPPNRIQRAFEEARANGRKTLVAFLTGGDPDLATSFRIAKTLVDSGVDLLEIGVPFSDPLADGPTIQASSGRALDAGATVPALLEHLARFREECDVPIVLFTYLNPIYVYGFEKFFQDAARSGADGILILDLPPDEAARNEELMRASGLLSIRLIAPTTPEKRVASICSQADGFIYYVSREGVTGEQSKIADSLGEKVQMIRSHTDLPVAVGFGISNPEQAAEVAAASDGVVIGSAIVRRIAEHHESPDLDAQLKAFLEPIAKVLHND